tara:strand:+ start:30 stop:890 length:861 start_codon:yes stop_codon:yes gene_type:complete
VGSVSLGDYSQIQTLNRPICKIMKRIILCLALSLTGTLCAEVTLVSEGFGGLFADDLGGTSADVFSSSIVDVGGSPVWSASTEFQADGTVDRFSSHGSALLDVGTYINDLKGDASAIFELEMTATLVNEFNSISTSDMISLGFYSAGITTGETFYSQNEGMGTIAFREYDSDSSDIYGIAGATDAYNVSDYAAVGVSTTLKLILDLTTYDGSTDFGSIAYYVNGSEIGSIALDSAGDFSYIGFSNANRGGGSVSDFSFVQIPEPRAYALMAGMLGLSYVMLRRRKV